MKKINLWLFSAIFICGLAVTMFTSCVDKTDNPTGDVTPVVEETDYTVMLYTVGGGNLDYNLEQDIAKAAAAIKTDNKKVRYIVQYKYSSENSLTMKPYPEKPLFDAADYADCLARETGDAQLLTISKDLRAAFDQAFISHAQVSNLPGSINANTLSVTIVDKATYNMELTDDTGWTFLFGDSYKINDFHADTGWGDWLAKNEQKPTGNPSGFQESESGEK